MDPLTIKHKLTGFIYSLVLSILSWVAASLTRIDWWLRKFFAPGATGSPRSSNLDLLDPIFFHSPEKSGGSFILLGSIICGLGESVPGNVLPE